MKKIVCFSIIAATALGFSACKKAELRLYNEEQDRINFVLATNRVDSLVNYTFVYSAPEVIYDTVWVKIRTMGFLHDQDRPIKLKQIPAKGMLDAYEKPIVDAVPGKHYVAFDNEKLAKFYVIKKMQYETEIPIVTIRDKSLKEEEVRLIFGIDDNGYFDKGYATHARKSITISDQLIKPTNWNRVVELYFAGAYGKVKHQFMIDAAREVGVTPDEKFFKDIVDKIDDMSLSGYWSSFFNNALIKRNREAGSILREEPLPGETIGKPVQFYLWQTPQPYE